MWKSYAQQIIRAFPLHGTSSSSMVCLSMLGQSNQRIRHGRSFPSAAESVKNHPCDFDGTTLDGKTLLCYSNVAME